MPYSKNLYIYGQILYHFLGYYDREFKNKNTRRIGNQTEQSLLHGPQLKNIEKNHYPKLFPMGEDLSNSEVSTIL